MLRLPKETKTTLVGPSQVLLFQHRRTVNLRAFQRKISSIFVNYVSSKDLGILASLILFLYDQKCLMSMFPLFRRDIYTHCMQARRNDSFRLSVTEEHVAYLRACL